jgi:hypothetical protein
MKFLWFCILSIFLVGCDYTEEEIEVGYKGKARLNPWLAAEKFCGQYEGAVHSLALWKAPGPDDSVWFIPASILSNESFTRQMEEWVSGGGHLVLLVENANAEMSDWRDWAKDEKPKEPLFKMLERSGIQLKTNDFGSKPAATKKVDFDGESYEVDAKSDASVSLSGSEPGVFVSTESGEGRITVLTDARIFRNRWIDAHQHADLLDALIQSAAYEGDIAFMRGSGLSLWKLISNHLWPVLLGLAVLLCLWLWKNFTRFGPLEAASDSSILRGYDHHLEALGDFQWRLDRAVALLTPLREQIVERGQRISLRAGRRDDDFFQFLADRADLPRERVQRALTEPAPADSSILTRTTADLQRLLQVLH